MINYMPSKKIRLSPSEISNAETTYEDSTGQSYSYTIIRRPQPDGRFWVAAVRIGDGLVLTNEFAEDRMDVRRAIGEVNRWMDKLAMGGPMSSVSRGRDKRDNTLIGANGMNKMMVARELVQIAKMLEAYNTHLTELGKELRPTITKALRMGLMLQGDDMRANPVFSKLLMYQEFGDPSKGTKDSAKYHYFAIYRSGEQFVGGNAYGRIGYPARTIEFARGDLDTVKAKVMQKIRVKMSQGDAYEEVPFVS